MTSDPVAASYRRTVDKQALMRAVQIAEIAGVVTGSRQGRVGNPGIASQRLVLGKVVLTTAPSTCH